MRGGLVGLHSSRTKSPHSAADTERVCLSRWPYTSRTDLGPVWIIIGDCVRGKKDPGLRSQPDSGLMNHAVDPTPQYVMMNSGRRPSAVDCVAQPGTFSSDVKCRRSIQDSNLSRSAE